MKVIYKNLLKKLSVDDIKSMRDLVRKGEDKKYIATAFGVAVTTVSWHTGDLPENFLIKLQ